MKNFISILTEVFGLVSAAYAARKKILRKMYMSEISPTSLMLLGIFILTSCSSLSGVVTENKRSGSAESLASGTRLMLRDSCKVQTSSDQPEGVTISKVGFTASGWYPDPFFLHGRKKICQLK
jgi:hypothetical protein